MTGYQVLLTDNHFRLFIKHSHNNENTLGRILPKSSLPFETYSELGRARAAARAKQSMRGSKSKSRSKGGSNSKSRSRRKRRSRSRSKSQRGSKSHDPSKVE